MEKKRIYILNSQITNQDMKERVKKFTIKHRINFQESSFKLNTIDKEKSIDSIIENLPYNSDVFIDNFKILGNSLFYILKRIKNLKENNITLHVIHEDLSLQLNNKPLFNVLDSLYKIEVSRIEHRTTVAKATRAKKGIKLGRKKGTVLKSKYEQYKRRILYLHKQGVPNTKIVKDIEIGTAQSLGKYIKQIKLQEKKKQKKKGTYLMTSDDLENISDWSTKN